MKERGGCLPVAAIILAAGAATRMGRLKQLLVFQGKTLVVHAIEQAVEAGFQPILVVVGAQSADVQKAIAAQPVEVVENSRWQSGMGSSISAGVLRLQELDTDAAAVAILLADQPLISGYRLKAMIRAFTVSGAGSVAAEYNGTLGVPALFARSLFNALASLSPELGARHLLRNPNFKVARFPLPEAAADVDTPEDFAALPASS